MRTVERRLQALRKKGRINPHRSENGIESILVRCYTPLRGSGWFTIDGLTLSGNVLYLGKGTTLKDALSEAEHWEWPESE